MRADMFPGDNNYAEKIPGGATGISVTNWKYRAKVTADQQR